MHTCLGVVATKFFTTEFDIVFVTVEFDAVFVTTEFDTVSFSGSGFMELAFSNENMAGCMTTGTTLERSSAWNAYDGLLTYAPASIPVRLIVIADAPTPQSLYVCQHMHVAGLDRHCWHVGV